MTRPKTKFLPLLALLVLAASGCSDDATAPEAPVEIVATDTPSIPRPTSPGGFVPTRSETVTKVSSAPLENFAPRILDLKGVDAEIEARAFESCDWEPVESASNIRLSGWSGYRAYEVDHCLLAGLYTNVLGYFRADLKPRGNHVVLRDGNWSNEVLQETQTAATFGLMTARMTVTLPEAPAEGPYIRRDRYWKLQPIEGQVGEFLLLTGPTSGSVSTSYTAGVARSQTETFGRSITGSVGLSLGPLSASVSATLSEGFSSSVSITEETTETFTKSVQGETGKTVQFMVWELVEEYSLSDKDGNPYRPERWTFADDKLVRNAAALALEATVFDGR